MVVRVPLIVPSPVVVTVMLQRPLAGWKEESTDISDQNAPIILVLIFSITYYIKVLQR